MKQFSHVPLASLDVNDITHLSKYDDLSSLDTGENYFFSRQLEFIIPEMLNFEHGRISARMVFPIDRRAGPAAEVITLRQMTKTGAAKIITDYANDIPLANVFTEEVKSSVRSIAEAAEWSVQEIRQSASVPGMALDRDKTEAVREDMLRRENSIAWQGDATHGLAGLFTDGNIPRFTVPAGVGGVPWSLKTGPEMVLDMNLTVNPISENTNGVEAPDTLLIPRAQYNLASSTQMGTVNDTTALEFFAKTNPYISGLANIIPIDDIAGLGTAGVDTLIAYEKNPTKLVMNIPLDIEQFPPQVRDMVTRVVYHMRAGGVLIKRPLSLRIGQGI
jgi:hypothetical protein